MKKIYKIINAKSYLFINVKSQKNIKITKEAIKINYFNILKYKDIFYYYCNEYLNIYNYNSKLFPISIPEGYILSKNLNDGIYIIKNPNGYFNIIIKKDNCIIRDYFLNYITPQDKKLLEFEFNLPIKEEEYNKLIKKGLSKLSFKDFINFIKLPKIDLKLIKEKLLSFSKPLLIYTSLITILAYIIKIYYQNQIEYKLKELQKIKIKTHKLTKEINHIKSLYQLYKTINKELQINEINIINEIASTLEQPARISYLKINENQILFTIDTNDSTILLKKLNQIKEIKNLKLISSIKINKTIKRYKFEGEIF